MKTYADAQGMCETGAMNGFTTGRLLEPKTLAFNNKVFAASLIAFGGKKEAWIGMNAKGGSWVYTSSGRDLDLENWEHWEPNNSGDCVYWGFSTYRAGTWGDRDCNRKMFFICEFV